MKKSTVRIFAIVLVVLMCLSLLPLAAAHAMEYPAEMPEIPGFTWMGDHYVETEHIYGEVPNEDFLVDASEPGDCETPALYWRSCINRNPYTEERCGVTAETAYQEALQRAANDLSAQRNSGVQHTDSEWQDIWNRTAEEILNRYTFSYGGFGHQWVEVEYQPATCEQNGWETYHYCSVCGEGLDYIPEIPATGHRYEDGICAVCGKADPDYAPVASSDNSAFALIDSADFNSEEPDEEQRNEPLPNNDETPVANADGDVVITYNANGGVGDDYPQTIAADATNDTLTPCGFTREHYTFIGWNTADDGTGDSFDDQQDVTAASFSGTAVTLYAQWRRSEVRIIFDGNGADGGTAMPDQLIELGGGADLSANTYMLSNNAFLGWSTRQDGSNTGTYFRDNQHVTVDSFETAVVTLYAQWDAIMVSFDANGGKLSSPFTTSYLVTEAGIDLPKSNGTNVTRNGPYKFVGWNTSSDGVGGKHFADGAHVSTADIPVRTTLYAEWQKVITVYYNANNGGENYNGGVFQPGITITVKELKDVATPTPSKPGRTFSGEWNTITDGSGDTYKPGDQIPLEEEPVKWTFFAQWDFDVTLNQNDGSGNTKKVTVRENKEYTVPELPEEFTYDEKTAEFKGWNTESTGNGTSYAPGDTIPGNKMTQPFALYARWADKHTITFNGNGVTEGVPDPITAEVNTEVALPSMTRGGYKFVGWATSADGDMKYPNTLPASDFTGDMTLYAVWQENPKVTLNPQNDEASQVVSINNDGSITLPKPERDGYKFLGWATSSDGAPVYHETIPASDVATLDGKTLYGKWDKEYTVTYHQNAGTTDTKTKDQTIYESDLNKEPVALSTIEELEFTNPGNAFTGWAKTADGEKVKGVSDTVSTVDFGTGTTLDLFAVWKDYATITFDKNSTAATGTMNPMKVTDESQQLPANAFTLEGYRFTGWNTDPTGYGTPYAEDAYVSKTVIGSDTTLYAQWTKVIKIKYLSNGGTGSSMPVQEALADKEIVFENNTYAKTDATFANWNTKPDGSGTTYKPGDKHTFSATDSDLTLYAQWTYTVTFDPNGEGSTGEIKPGNKDKAFEKQAYDIPENMSEGEDPKPLITRTGYVFTGWNTKADGTGDKYADGGTIPASKVTGPITLYAQWDQEYTVSFKNTKDATQTMEPQIILKSDLDKAEKTGGVALNPNTFTYEGYVFTGWSKNEAGTDGHFDDEGKVKATNFDSYATLTLYAQWEHEIVITFKPGYDSTLTHTQSVAKDKEVKELDANPFTRPQYLFKNWKTDDGKLYEDKGSIPAEYVTKDFTLTAQWVGPLTIKDTVTGSDSVAYVGEPIQATITGLDDDTGITYEWYARETPTSPSRMRLTDVGKTIVRAAIPKNGTTEMPYIYCVASKGSEEDGTYQETQSNYILLKDELDTVKWGMDFINDGNLEKYPNAQYHTIPGYIEGVEEGMYYSTNEGASWTKIPSSQISEGNFLVPTTGTYLIKPSEKSTVTSAPITIYNWYVVGYTVSNSSSAGGTASMNASNSSSSSGAMPSTPVLVGSTQKQRNDNTILKLASNLDNLWAVRSDNSRSITLTVKPTNSYAHVSLNGTTIDSFGSTRSSSTSSSSTRSSSTTSSSTSSSTSRNYSVSPVNQPKIYSIIFNNFSTSPGTGDESHLGLWSALCLISLTGSATILGKTFKRKKTR